MSQDDELDVSAVEADDLAAAQAAQADEEAEEERLRLEAARLGRPGGGQAAGRQTQPLRPTQLNTYNSATFNNNRDLASWFVRFVGYIDRDFREPTSQLGDFVVNSHERLKNPGGRRSNQDALAEGMAMRSWTKGDDVDQLFETGQATGRLLAVPLYGHTKTVLKGFKVKWLDEGETSPYQLTWEELVEKLRIVLTEMRGRNNRLARKLDQYLNDPLAYSFLEVAYDSSIQLKLHFPHWAQGRGNFDLDILRAGGDVYWVLDRNSPQDYTHRYRGFMSPTKKWLDERIKKYFDQHPIGAELRTLMGLTKIDTPHHHFGGGPLRHRPFQELWCPEWFADVVKQAIAGNLINWRQAWRLRYHYWRAYEQAFREYVLDFRNCVGASRDLELGRANPTGEIDPAAACKLTTDQDWDLRITSDPFGPAGRNAYFNWHVQSPPSLQYMFWQMVEALIQFRRTYDGQTKVERIMALEMVLNMISWCERLPRVWKDGKIYWSWMANPEHKGADGGHCQGCLHWDQWVPIPDQDVNADFSPDWLPDEDIDPEVYRDWVRQEVQVWYATRQELNLIRKVIFTHNVGSGHTDVFFHGLLRDTDAVSDRMSYLGGGNENFDWRLWYVPGVFLYGEPMVGRDWLLGHVARMAKRGIRLPFNSIWLRSNKLRTAFQSSGNGFDDLLGLNNTDLGVAAENVRKHLNEIFNWEDMIVFPNSDGEFNYYRNADGTPRLNAAGEKILFGKDDQGREWVDFDPVLNPERPNVILYNDPAFHVDPKWFDRRSLLDPLIIQRRVDAFVLIFGEHKQYRMSWPGTEEVTYTQSLVDPAHPEWGTNFRSYDFWMYLVANYSNHKVLAYDFWKNQDVEKAMETVAEELEYAENDGQAFLRPMLYKLTEGLPHPFRPRIAKLREKYDGLYTNRLAFYAATGHRGAQPAMVTGASEKGYLLGYDGYEIQHTRLAGAFKSTLWNKWGDHIAWTLRYFQMIPNPKDPIDVRNYLAKEMASGNMNWEAAEITAAFLGKFMGGIWGRNFTYAKMLPKRPPQEAAFEDWFDNEKLLSMLPPVGDHNLEARRAIIWAAHNKLILHAPTTPESLRNWT